LASSHTNFVGEKLWVDLPGNSCEQGTLTSFTALLSPGGDAEKFKEINTAYEVLRDPEKRKIYDEVSTGSCNERHLI
jgi:hypothetical protein